MNFEQIVDEVKNSNGKPVWVTVGQSQVDVSNGSGKPHLLDESERQTALAFFQNEPADILGDLNDWKKWYAPEDWEWLMEKLRE